MLMPTRNLGESTEDYVARFAGTKDAIAEYPQREARISACLACSRSTVLSKSETTMRRIKRASISTISLVPKGANQIPVLYKSDDNHIQFDTIIKDNLVEKGELVAIVYAPEMRDSQGDIASASVIKEMAYEFAKNGLGSIDLQHDGKDISKEDAFVAESFIVEKGDGRFSEVADYSGNIIKDLTGAWAVVIKIENEDLKKLYKEGKWNGVSMYGSAEVVETEKSDDDLESLDLDNLTKAQKTKMQQLLSRMSNHLGLSHASAYQSITLSGDIDMTPEELTKAIAAGNAELVKSMNESNTALLTKAGILKPNGEVAKEVKEEKETPAPLFKGDISDAKAVKKFEYDTKRFAIEKGIDMSDPAAITDAAASIAELNKEFADVLEDKTIEKAAPSNAAVDDGTSDSFPISAGLSKEEADCVAIGKKMAESMNKSRGFVTA